MDYGEIAAMSRRRVTITTCLPLSLLEVLDRIADAEGTAMSRVFVRVLRRGLEVERAERQAKAGT